MEKAKRTENGDAERQADNGSEDFLTYVSGVGEARGGRAETLGDRVRRAREGHGVSLSDLSERTGIGVDKLRGVESNEVIPPLGELVKLGKALHTRMGYFISPGTEKVMSVVRASERRQVARHKGRKAERYGYSYQSLAPDKANRKMEPFIVTLQPSEDEEASTHDGEEFILVLEGEIKVRVADRTDVLGPGDALYYDSSEPHFVGCVGGEARIVAVLLPG